MKKLFKTTDYRLQTTEKPRKEISVVGRQWTVDQQKGQIAVVLLLFILVALAIGLAVTQRSLTSITTSNQSEQVSRAFSAAEAGIEKSVNLVPLVGTVPAGLNILQSDLNNQSSAAVKVVNNLPNAGLALEYPPIGKDILAQFWLANPAGSTWNAGVLTPDNPQFFYGGSFVDIYFGNDQEPTNRPAIEISLISFDGTDYVSSRTFYDPDVTRRVGNGFAPPTSCPVGGWLKNTSSSATKIFDDRPFLCSVRVPLAGTPIMIRARIIYSNIKQPIAASPVATGCASRCSLPFQAAIYSSTGISGQSQKTLQVFREANFMPSFLDFAIFSSGSIEKN